MDDLYRIARRFPLVARPRPACQPLDLRVREVCDVARAAVSQTGPAPLALAATTRNRAALIASDCGLPELARSLCWRQAHLHLRSRPWSARAARYALEPIVNLARLMIRGGDGERAHQLLDTLYLAVRSRSEAVLDGTRVTFRDLAGSDEEHRELCRWLWAVLLADGTRALTVAGRWDLALAHVEQLRGVGRRLLDGRQVAIVARCVTGDPASALARLEESAPSTPWEQCVAACLTVLCLRATARPVGRAVRDMVDRYLGLQLDPEFLVFHGRLGLAVVDLADGSEGAQVAARVVDQAVVAGDGYMARDVLAHARCSPRLTDADQQALSAAVLSCGLGCGAMPAHLMSDLMSAVEMSETATELMQTSVTRRVSAPS